MTGREHTYLKECVDTNFVSSVGPFVDKFETLVGATTGAEFCVATSSGTTGLHVALLALQVKPGDLVMIPSFTFIATANAVRHCGADPWLFDVDKTSWTMSVPQLEAALASCERTDAGLIHRSSGRRVAAIMPVYTLGTPADMDGIAAVAQAAGIPVVADSAAAVGATFKGKKTGQLSADLTVYSFNGNKTITAGGGGAVCGNDKALIDLVRHLSTTAKTGPDYSHDMVGYNYRMTNVQAAVGCAQMEMASEFVDAKQRIFETYRSALQDVEGIEFFPCPPDRQSSCWFSSLLIDNDRFGPVTEIVAALNASDIGARPFWKPVHLQEPYRLSQCEDMAVTDSIWKRVLTLPCSTGLTENDQRHVIDNLRRILGL